MESPSPETPGGGSRDKICLVCGDKALGYNFNAITCESCKAFFRRNALKDKDFKCPFNKKCEINTVTRRFCQLCRLIKCFEIGMKKEYIMSEEDKKEKRRKIKQKRVNPAIKSESDGETCDNLKEENSFKKKKKMEFVSNPLNMASMSNKTYEKRLGPSPNIEHFAPNPSPSIPEPSSPIGPIVMEANTSNYIGHSFETNRSRPVEIYQVLKPQQPQYEYRDCDSSTAQGSISRDNEDTPAEDFSDCGTGNRFFQMTNSDDRSCTYSQKEMPLLTSLVGGSSETSNRRRLHRPNVAEIFNDIPSKNSRFELSNSIESILSEAIKLEYEAYSSLNPRINSRELNDAERAKLNELIVANKALLAPMDDYVSNLVQEEASCKFSLASRPMLVDVLNLTAVAIRRLIKMAKKVNAFKNMCQEDQVALLKGGCTEMMILRSAMTYDSDRGSWKIPHSQESLIKVDVLKEAGGKVFEEHQRFLQTFDPKWRQDENIMLILSAITLFTPDRPRVVHYDVIKLEQYSYYYLLRRYLESTYPGCEARSAFLKLIHKIAELHRLNEDHVRVYMELNPQDVEPLLIEIFDLNPR